MTTNKVGSRARETEHFKNNVEKRIVKLTFVKSVSKPISASQKKKSSRAREMRFFCDGWDTHGQPDILVFATSSFVYAKRYLFSKNVVSCTQNATLWRSVR